MNKIILASIFLIPFLGSCGKKKCYDMANGDSIYISLFHSNNTPLSSIEMKSIKYYYKKTGGGTDTLGPDPDNPTRTVKAQFVSIYFEGDFMSIAGLPQYTLKDKIQGGYLYLQFPNGITDSLRINLRNKEGCDPETRNFYIDGLIYNQTEATFIDKVQINKRGYGTNWFKAYIH